MHLKLVFWGYLIALNLSVPESSLERKSSAQLKCKQWASSPLELLPQRFSTKFRPATAGFSYPWQSPHDLLPFWAEPGLSRDIFNWQSAEAVINGVSVLIMSLMSSLRSYNSHFKVSYFSLTILAWEPYFSRSFFILSACDFSASSWTCSAFSSSYSAALSFLCCSNWSLYSSSSLFYSASYLYLSSSSKRFYSLI